MIVTQNLSLTVWDQEKDDFEHSKLADNWTKIDEHDHVGILEGEEPVSIHADQDLEAGVWEPAGRGRAITTRAILPEAIWRYLIALRAVGHKQIGLQEVWSENIKNENVLTNHIKVENVTTPKVADEAITWPKLDPQILSIGSTILWYRATTGAEPGGSWQICDGSKFMAGNKMGAGEAESVANIPNLIKVFPRGSSLATIGETGGAEGVNLAHAHTVNPHSHVVNSHSHSISSDGNHKHGFKAHDGHYYDPYSRYVGLDEDPDNPEGTPFANVMHIPQDAWPAPNEEPEEMKTLGAHTHGGATGAEAPGTGNTAPGTDVQLGNVTTLPPFIGFVYIMRVR